MIGLRADGDARMGDPFVLLSWNTDLGWARRRRPGEQPIPSGPDGWASRPERPPSLPHLKTWYLEVRRVHVPLDLRDLRHLAAVVHADLRLDRGFELAAHARDQVRVPLPV